MLPVVVNNHTGRVEKSISGKSPQIGLARLNAHLKLIGSLMRPDGKNDALLLHYEDNDEIIAGFSSEDNGEESSLLG